MGPTGDFFSGLSGFYLLIAGFTLYQVRLHWREFWTDALTPRARQLAASVAFFLLVPLAVLLHEFGHMLAAWSTGSRVLGLHYFAYWGYVEYIPARADAVLDWYVALAGNLMSFLLGVVCIVAALRFETIKPVLRVVLMQLGVIELAQTLVYYPIMSFLPGFAGDWLTIYSFKAPLASGATLVLHLVALGYFIYLLRANKQAIYLLRGE